MSEFKKEGHSIVAGARADTTESLEHTPGPWEWDRGDDGNIAPHPYSDISDAEETIIASVNFHIEAGDANARLIASAPKLLADNERLRKVLKNLINASYGLSDSEKLDRATTDAMEALEGEDD